MKDYYEILSVRRTATAHEIKRAYRLLAVRYHPDKNPDPVAEQFFKEINEAYQVLGDPVERQLYDNRFINNTEPVEYETPRTQSRHRDPAYRRRDPSVKVKSEKQRLYEMMEQYVPLMRKVVVVALVVSGVLFVDFILPNELIAEKILHSQALKSRSNRGSVAQWRIITSSGKVIDVLYSYASFFDAGDIVSIERTRILGVIRYISTDHVDVRINKSLYGNFLFAPLGLLGTAIFGWYYRWRVDYVFNAGVVSILMLMLTFVLYLILH
jgi:hypothetical protein